MQNQTSPLILTFGVSDPVGATGVQADQAVFGAHGCHALTVVTGLLIADTARIEDMQEIDSDWVADQARVVLEDMPVAAFKVGAIASVEQAAAIAEIVSDYPDVPLILDPFLSSLPDSGLADDDMLSAIRQILVPQATVLMLSQVELARMAETWRDAGDDAGESEEAAEGAGALSQASVLEQDVAELTRSGCEFVLITGTKDSHGVLSNTLFDADGVVASVPWQHLPGPFTGAGSTLSAALTALMALEVDTEDALGRAQDYTTGTLTHAQRFGMGKFIPNKFFRAAKAGTSSTSTTDHDH